MVDTVLCSLSLITFLTFVIFCLFKKYHKKQYFESITGPPGLPFFGSLFKMDHKNLHFTLDEWGYKYGDMFYFTLLGKQYLVINSSTTAREMYMHEPTATVTSGRTPTFIAKYFMEHDDVILTSMSPEWSYRRKVTHQVLQAYGGGLKQIEKQTHFLLDEIVKRLKTSQNDIIDPSTIIDDFLLTNLELLLSGTSGNKTLQNLLKQLDEDWNFISHPSLNRILVKVPFIRHMPGNISKIYNRMVDTRKQLMDILKCTSDRNPELTGIYQSIVQKAQEDEGKTQFKMTMNNVKMIITDILVAAYLTTGGTLKSILKILVSRPEVQRKIQAEIDKTVGSGRLPSLSDRENCPFTEAVMLETLRYISHTPVTGHYTMDDFVFKGINIPKNTSIDDVWCWEAFLHRGSPC